MRHLNKAVKEHDNNNPQIRSSAGRNELEARYVMMGTLSISTENVCVWALAEQIRAGGGTHDRALQTQ